MSSIRPLSLLLLLAHAPLLPAQAEPAARDSALRAELLQRVALDQRVREDVSAMMRAGAALDTTLLRRMMRVDSANTAWLRGILESRGWPGRSNVGVDGADAAFLLVQHADADTSLQARVLPLLERAFQANEATGQQLAMLSDRVAVARGQAQLYGTQASVEGGRVIFRPIADSIGVDARRARLGLPPLAEYRRVLDSVYTRGSPRDPRR